MISKDNEFSSYNQKSVVGKFMGNLIIIGLSCWLATFEWKMRSKNKIVSENFMKNQQKRINKDFVPSKRK